MVDKRQNYRLAGLRPSRGKLLSHPVSRWVIRHGYCNAYLPKMGKIEKATRQYRENDAVKKGLLAKDFHVR